jgi:hypothetical protein
MNLTDEQAEGRACVSCHKPGTVADGQRVGTCEGHVIWACLGGCVIIASMAGGAQ